MAGLQLSNGAKVKKTPLARKQVNTRCSRGVNYGAMAGSCPASGIRGAAERIHGLPGKPVLILAQNNIRGFGSDLVAGSPDDAGSPDHAEAGVGARAPANAAAPDHGRAVHENVRSPDY